MATMLIPYLRADDCECLPSREINRSRDQYGALPRMTGPLARPRLRLVVHIGRLKLAAEYP